MKKSIVFIFLLYSALSFANDGILPFTGIKYFEKGIYAKSFEVNLDDKTWTSNRLPVNTNFVIKVIKPQGFSTDSIGQCNLNASVYIINNNGDTVGSANKFFGEDNYVVDALVLSSLSLTLGFKEGTPLGQYKVLVSFYDQLKPSSLDLELNLELVDSKLPLNNTSSVYGVSSYTGYNGKSSGTILSKVDVAIENGSSKYLTHKFHLNELAGVTKDIFKKGVYTISVFDTALNEVTATVLAKESEVQITSAKGIKDAGNIFYKVFFKDEDTAAKNYTVRFRWESADQSKVIDFINVFNKL